ncbi:Replication factor C subunit 4 [Amphibalanus amphitrite]|uniref:Replication factor C subunit 2 n=2 Tax=Amphibalanus amphitrite TaxID=1232801 RepID=A0A6A4V9I2_AMPAM|nr:replication factor C subunit 4-like isoform X3 [Amphibalanus amphitrite]XP_043202620.1 replication factor C subunit 4-like isoform X3 [Amphibalanus amphitrite]XP_043202621.1 replication factor C subunit 4-like isoform X3 [Amphibalanus amphitrite]XP_043243954.1 replication factor C subunit 4-like [Amphibalanus amphitrite]XP_043243955.1 replication factor C subunit 4-like [Amphibalanus amphitrite]XP_043243956.1 replication factor C subunit 4-like [Amphibalanus amphitrite]KAF0292927.1 Replica
MHAFLKTGKLGASDASAGGSGLTAKEKKRNVHQPWVEKYRPKTVDDVAYQDEVIAMLKNCMKGSDLPNLLFYGPPGTGKTSTILAACRELFGSDMKQRVLELNASDERGIAVVRDKVKGFSQQAVPSCRSDGKACPAYKVVILDEADSMTSAAQAALRRTMERETRTTRFCLICNYVSRIIDPLTSRCAKFRFKPLSTDILVRRLRDICTAEGVDCDEPTLAALVETSDGDLRKAITTLQSAARLRPAGGLTAEDVKEVMLVVPDAMLDRLLDACRSGRYEKLETAVNELILEGYAAAQVLSQLLEKLIALDGLDDLPKAHILERLALCDARLQDGADEYLQIMDLGCVIMAQMKASG